MATLTKRQKEVLDYVEGYINERGYSPTFEEIRDHLGLSAISTVHEHVSSLVEKGFLNKENNCSRGLEFVRKEVEISNLFLEIQLVGMITAGKPIEAITVPDEAIKIARDSRFTSGKLYALKVKGNSMIGEGIFDGDVVIVKDQKHADNGDTVVAIVDDNEATLKKFYKEKNRIRLQPANPSLSPIYRKDVEIRGVVVKVLRDFR